MNKFCTFVTSCLWLSFLLLLLTKSALAEILAPVHFPMMRSIVFLFYALLACDDFRHCHQGLTPAEARGREARPAPKFCGCGSLARLVILVQGLRTCG